AQTTTGIRIPCALSFLAFQDFQAPVSGLNDFPADEIPPVGLTFQSYHMMINLGVAFIGMGLLGILFYWRKRKVFEMRWLLWLFVLSIFMAEAATIAGWWTAEIGRQPWIVWELLRTADAVSPTLGTGEALFSVIIFVVLYIILGILCIDLLNEKIQHGPEPLEAVEAVPVSSLPDTFREVFREPRAGA